MHPDRFPNKSNEMHHSQPWAGPQLFCWCLSDFPGAFVDFGQAVWLGRMWAGALPLAEEGELVAAVRQDYGEVAASGGWPRHAHRMGGRQWDYNRMLAREALADVSLHPWFRSASLVNGVLRCRLRIRSGRSSSSNG